MNSIGARLGAATLAVVLLFGSHLDAQDSGLIVCPPRAISKLGLALPQIDLGASYGSGDRAHADQIEEGLRQGLEDSGLFILYGPTDLSVLTLVGRHEHDFDQYRSLGSDLVLMRTLQQVGDEIVLDGRVYDLPSRELILQKRFSGKEIQARRLGQSLAEAFRALLTGASQTESEGNEAIQP